jgi:hypothetical protein
MANQNLQAAIAAVTRQQAALINMRDPSRPRFTVAQFNQLGDDLAVILAALSDCVSRERGEPR